MGRAGFYLFALLCATASGVGGALGPTNAPRAAIELPYEVRQGDLLVRARINGSELMTFDCDTGSGVTTVRPDVAQDLKLEAAGRMTIVGIAGEEPATTYRGAVFEFGGVSYSPRRVAALASDSRKRRMAGTLGVGFFRRFVVDIDPGVRPRSGSGAGTATTTATATGTMRLSEPALFQYEGSGEILPLEFVEDMPVVRATIVVAGHEVEGRFSLDTGCDGNACLEPPFITKHKLLERLETRGSTRSGIGGVARVRTAGLDKLQLGKLILERLSADFFLEGSPAAPMLAGHIGMEVLGRFRVIFDYSRKRVILEEVSGPSAARSSQP